MDGCQSGCESQQRNDYRPNRSSQNVLQ
jgi:hypothetical protein